MERKIMWMRYLLIGISIALLIKCSCKPSVDYYVVKSRWIYINETGHNITYYPDAYNEKFGVKSYGTTIYFEDGDETIEPEKNPILKFCRRYLPITKEEHGGDFMVKEGGRNLTRG